MRMVLLWCGGVLVFAGLPCLRQLRAPTPRGFRSTGKGLARSSLLQQALTGMMLSRTPTTRRNARFQRRETWAITILACLPNFLPWDSRHQLRRRLPQRQLIAWPIMERAIRRLRLGAGSPVQAEVALGAKCLAVAVEKSRCQSKLKLVLQMVGCQLVRADCCPFQEQQVLSSASTSPVLFSFGVDSITHMFLPSAR